MLLQRLEILGLAIGAVILSAHHINAQSVIVPDNTLGTETSIVTPSQDFESVTGGATRGTGLFHSFSQFNISDRGNVRFIVRPEIQNIFARVTGNNPSQILGTLGVRSDVAGELLPSTASLFLLNPNGILFGQNAKLDLGGAFVATTASSFKFGDQEFSTINPQTPPLLTINVPTGLQFGQKVGAIEVNRANLATNTGKGLSLIGGTVSSIDGSIVSNGGGELNITAFDQDALANLTFSTNGWKVSPNANAQFRDIQIDGTQVSLLTSNLLNPDQTIGNFYILGKSVNLAGKSFISYFHDKVNQPNIQPGTLVINATDAIQLDNSTLFAGGDSSMDTPGIEISARSLILRDGNIFLAQSTASPKAKITINVSENMLVSGASGRISGIGSFNFSNAKQLGEAIQITTGSLIVENGASIITSTSQNSLGDSGGIAITSDTIDIAGEGSFP